MIYLVGSLRNPQVPIVAGQLRAAGYEVFDDWYSPGEQTDEKWQAYEKARGRGYKAALAGAHAQNVFTFDKVHLEGADVVVLLLPAGKSAHLELGWCLGKGKPGFILMNGEPERYDVMSCFATDIATDVEELLHMLETLADSGVHA